MHTPRVWLTVVPRARVVIVTVHQRIDARTIVADWLCARPLFRAVRVLRARRLTAEDGQGLAVSIGGTPPERTRVRSATVFKDMLAVICFQVTGVYGAGHAVVAQRDILAPRLVSAVVDCAWVAVITGDWPTIGAPGQWVTVHDVARPSWAVHRRVLTAPIGLVAQVIGAEVGVIAEHRGEGAPRGLRVTGVCGARVTVLADDGHLFAGPSLKDAP